jgi:dolichol-phosphate hexosyltransferase
MGRPNCTLLSVPGREQLGGPGPLRGRGAAASVTGVSDASAGTVPEDRLRGAEAAIILPTLNEEAGLEHTIRELRTALARLPFVRAEPVVIDGGSVDNTVAVARAAGVPVFVQRSRGKGAAIVEAFDRIGDLGVRYGVVLDADATYPAEAIGPALSLLHEGTDLVIGVRQPNWGPPRDFRDLVHRVGNLILSYSASLLTRRTILDLCSGFWGISTAQFASLGISSSSFAVEAELVLKALHRDFIVSQIPIDYRERIGEAKLRAVRDGLRIFLTILGSARPVRPVVATPPSRGPPVPSLLSIWAISGAQSAIVEAHPSRYAEADRLTRALRENAPATQTVVDAGTAYPPPLADAPLGRGITVAPLLISLPWASSPAPGPAPVSVVIRSQNRRLTVDLPAEPVPHLALQLDEPESSFAESGGFMLRRSGPGLSSLAVLRSRLELDPLNRRRTLLAANGFPTTERDERPVSMSVSSRPIDPPAAPST